MARRRHCLHSLVVLTAGMTLQISTCGDLGRYFTRLNPCETILECDPVQYRFISSGYDGPGADPQIDPACTFPPYCDNDPFVNSTTQGNP